MRSRSMTQTINKPKISVIVEQYKCQDHTVLSKIGALAQRQTWSIRAVGTGQTPEVEHEKTSSSSAVSSVVSLETVVDKGVAGVKGAMLGTQVCIRTENKQVHPPRGDRAKLWEDFTHEWNFHGMVPGIGMVSPTEKWIPGTLPTEVANKSGMALAVQDAILGESSLKSLYEIEVNGLRHPAVINQQRPEGYFEVTAFQPDENGIIQAVPYPSFEKSHIFVAGTGTPIAVPQCSVVFTMPHSNPYAMALTTDGVSFTELLGRVSPKFGTRTPRITMDVPKAHKQLVQSVGPMVGVGSANQDPISVNVGPNVFGHFLSGEARIGDTGATRLSKWWRIQLGPFAEHSVKIEKKSRLGSILTLTVDDEILAECSGVDIGSSPGTWHCKFRFVGERHLDFNVFERTQNNVELDTKGVVTKCFSYEHIIEIHYQHRKLDDLGAAQMTVDGVPAHQLPFALPKQDSAEMRLSRDVLASQYGLQVPDKVVPQDTRSTARKLAGRVLHDFERKNGPLDEVVAHKANETGAFFSKLASDVQGFFKSSQTNATEPYGSDASPYGNHLPSLLTNNPSKEATV